MLSKMLEAVSAQSVRVRLLLLCCDEAPKHCKKGVMLCMRGVLNRDCDLDWLPVPDFGAKLIGVPQRPKSRLWHQKHAAARLPKQHRAAVAIGRCKLEPAVFNL